MTGVATSTAVFGSSEVATIELPSPSCPSIVDYSIDIAWQSPWKLSHKCQGQQQYMRKSTKQEKLKGSYEILSEAIIAFYIWGRFWRTYGQVVLQAKSLIAKANGCLSTSWGKQLTASRARHQPVIPPNSESSSSTCQAMFWACAFT